MSLIEPEFVQVVAEGLGIKPTSDASTTLAPDVEYRLREIVQEASKFARHAKRTYITPEDVNNAFKLRNVEPVYGLCSSSDPARFTRAAGHADIVYAEDPVVPLSTILDAPLPPLPWEAGVTVHWLAVNGKQPAIPENLPLVPPSHRDKRQRTEAARKALPALAVPPAADVVTATAPAAAEAAAAAAAGTTAAPSAGVAFEEGSLVRAPLKHVVSKELHLYFNKVITTLETATPPPAPASKELLAVLASLRTDAGLQPLAPYFAHFIAEKVGLYLASAPRLNLLLTAAVSLGRNSSIDLGPYLHEIIPAVLTCLLSHSIGDSGDGGDANGSVGGKTTKKKKLNKEENSEKNDTSSTLDHDDALHWTVREEAARAVAALCSTYPDAAPRVQRQLLSILTSPTSSLPSKYGAVLGLEAQGPRVVRSLLLPNLIPAVVALKEDLSGRKGPRKLSSALRVRGALLAASGYCVYLSGVCDAWNNANVEGVEKEGTAPDDGGSKQKRGASGAAAGGRKKGEKAKLQPKIAKMSRKEAEKALETISSRPASAAATAGGAGGSGKRGRGVKKLAPASAAAIGKKDGADISPSSAPMPLSEVFGEEEELDATTASALTAAAQKSLKKVLSVAGMRPANQNNTTVVIPTSGTANGTADGITGISGTMTGAAAAAGADLFLEGLPSVNYLSDAWQENFPVERLHNAMHELFGDDIAPYER